MRRQIHFSSLLALFVCALAACFSGLAGSPGAGWAASGSDRVVLVAPLVGDVDPVMADFVDRTLDAAERRDDVAAVVFELDTPGGMATSMDDIMKRFAGARHTPVLVWVGPSGARAASAGTFITYASDIAAMAPGTNIGSATPITATGDDLPKDLRRKVLNDAVAKIREQALLHDRNADFAEHAVRRAENVGAREALDLGVVDHVSRSVSALLRQTDGTKISAKRLTLHVAGAHVERVDMPLTLRILRHLVNPDLLFLLFGAGLVGLIIELTHPGMIVPGVAGAICLLLALYGMQVLPTTGTGVTLLLVGLGLIVAEALVVSGGVLGTSGAVAVTVGGLFLYDDTSGYGISSGLLIGVGTFLVLGILAIARVSWRIRRTQASTGSDALAGRIARVRRPIRDGDDTGTVFVAGEIWAARLSDHPAADTANRHLDVGSEVRVVGRVADALILTVEPVTDHPDKETAP